MKTQNQINLSDRNIQPVEQNQMDQPTITPEKPKINYLIIGGLTLICFILFGFGGYYLGTQSNHPSSKKAAISSTLTPKDNVQSSPQPTDALNSNLILGEINDGFQTIENRFFKYSISLPTNWKVYFISSYDKLSDEKTPLNIKFYYYDYVGPFEYPEWEVSIDGSNELGITEPIDAWFYSDENRLNKYYSLIKTNVASFSGYKMIPHNNGLRENPPDPIIYIINHNKKIYTISTAVSESKNNTDKFEQQYNQVLSTFKFFD